MKGHIAGCDNKKQVGVISYKNKSYYFGYDVWQEENPPYIDCFVKFDTEDSGDKKHPKVTVVSLIGDYLGPVGEPVKSRKVAIVLSLLFGFVGGGRFYLGYRKIGIFQIIATVVTLGFATVWGFIETILLLMNRIVKDAEGRPLK